jgi:predicted nucleotidyltransferase component of viral defense system
MIPAANILQWTEHAPWPAQRQIEQDLIICRALCDIYSTPFLAERLAFRGGTAINKLLFASPLRYSEDIDLVQVKAEPIGPTIDALRETLAWLGDFRRDRAEHSIHFLFKFQPEDATGDAALNLKIEINTREHDSMFGYRRVPFSMTNDWHSASVEILSFDSHELFGTKLMAFLQRRKNRDLFDLGGGLTRLGLDPNKVVAAFHHYLDLEGKPISRAEAEERTLEKLQYDLIEDVTPLLPPGVEFDANMAVAALEHIWRQFISRLNGDPWKSTPMRLEQVRKTFPTFLA